MEKARKVRIKMKIAVIDGQGGGVGKIIVERLVKEFGKQIHIMVLGTNSIATSLILKAGANEGATGANSIVYNASKVDVILGPIGIISANSLLGELTPEMARAISESSALKILIPINRCNIKVAGVENKAIQQYVEDAIELVRGQLS